MILVAIECGNLMPLNLTAIPQKYEKHGLCLQVLFVGQQRSAPLYYEPFDIYHGNKPTKSVTNLFINYLVKNT